MGRVLQTLGFQEPETRATETERRDPTAATVPLQYVSPGMAQVDEWNAEQAIRLAYYSNVIVFRAVQIVATTLSALPFLAGRRPPKRPGQTAEFDDACRLAQLLGPPPGGPAPKLTARRLWAWTIAQRLVTGKHGWEIETTGDEVAALWPLTSGSLRAIPAVRGSEWFARFEYGPSHDPKRLPADRVLYGWDPSAYDFRQPESPLQAARLDISIAVMMDRYNVAFLRNDMRPAAVVVTEAFAKQEEFEAFKGRFRGEYGGPDNAGKALFVEAREDGSVDTTIDIKTLGLSHSDAQFMEQHKESLQRIAIALGVPWSKFDASGRTFDNAGEEAHAWWESTLLPRLADLADEVNMQLAPRLGREVGWFDTSGVRALQAPKQFTQVGVPSLLTARLVTIDEGRAMIDQPALPNGEGNRFLTDEELAVIQGPAQLLSAALLPATTALPAPVVEDVPPANTERAVEVETRDEVDHEVRRATIWRRSDMAVRTLEARWEKRLKALFRQQADSTISRLEGKRGRQVLARLGDEQRAPGDELFDPDYWQSRTAEVAEDLYEQVLTAGVMRVTDLFGIAFDLESEWASAFVTARSNQLAGQVTTTTYEAIQAALIEGVAEGEGIPELAARVRHVFDVATTSRATTIARTEVISAYNGGANLGAQQLPDDVVGGREWISTRDGRTRADHSEADGLVATMDAPFYVGGDALEYPGDPNGAPGNVVNCRCTVAFLTPEEMEEAIDGGTLSGRVSTRFAEKLAARVALGEISSGAAVREVRRSGRRSHVQVVPEVQPTHGGTTVEVISQKVEAPPPRRKRIVRDSNGLISEIIEGDL